MVMDASGANQKRLVAGGDNTTPAWSPDGEWIAFSRSGIAAPGIYMIRRDGTGLCRVVATAPSTYYGSPTWSPTPGSNGRHQIIYADMAPSELRTDLFAADASCSSAAIRLTDTPDAGESWPAWSPDGLTLAACVAPASADCDLHLFDVTTNVDGGLGLAFSADLTAAGPLAGHAGIATWTEDGAQLVVVGSEGPGVPDLWVIPVVGADAPVRLTNTPGVGEMRPSWSPDRTRIVFEAESNLYTAAVLPGWSLGQPTTLLDSRRVIYHFPSWRPIP